MITAEFQCLTLYSIGFFLDHDTIFYFLNIEKILEIFK